MKGCDLLDCSRPRTYICIDLKSYYASVEDVSRGYDPLKCNLLVANNSRTDKTIVLAVSPALKAIGVPGRPRLFEAKQKIREYEIAHHTRILYEIAVPRMAEYIRVSSKIYEIYRRYVAAEDIHVYSIDECFIDVTGYLHFYEEAAKAAGVSPAHQMAITMIRDVLKETGITATVGIGTNLYLAKVGMDIVAKKAPADKDGVRIAELDEDKYKLLLWDHRPLTDFWMIGPGTARKLEKHAMFTLGDVATAALYDEGQFYKMFGIDAEILLDHVWGIEPCLMSDIKSYKNKNHSLSKGQVLPRPYAYDEAKFVFTEMVDLLATDLLSQNLTAGGLSFWVSFDPKSLEENPYYEGPVSIDFYQDLRSLRRAGRIRREHRQQERGVCGADRTGGSRPDRTEPPPADPPISHLQRQTGKGQSGESERPLLHAMHRPEPLRVADAGTVSDRHRDLLEGRSGGDGCDQNR